MKMDLYEYLSAFRQVHGEFVKAGFSADNALAATEKAMRKMTELADDLANKPHVYHYNDYAQPAQPVWAAEAPATEDADEQTVAAIPAEEPEQNV